MIAFYTRCLIKDMPYNHEKTSYLKSKWKGMKRAYESKVQVTQFIKQDFSKILKKIQWFLHQMVAKMMSYNEKPLCLKS